MTRVAVFIDYQNTYMGARESFGRRGWFMDGQIYPRRVGVLLTDRGRAVDASRELERVVVFRGEPNAKHNRGGQAACQRQVRFWNAQKRVQAITRPLKYTPAGIDNHGETIWKAEEKGIDVLVALAMAMGAMRDEYDVAILVSADTDLLPAVETVFQLGKRCEVAAWQGRVSQRSRLALLDRHVWCHWLNEQDYERLHDPTDYTRPQPGEPPSSP